MSFLKRLLGALLGSSPEGPVQIGRQDPLARYLLYSKYFSSATRRVKPGAFLPPKDLKLSVFNVKGLDDDGAWGLARDHVVPQQPGRTLHGRAELAAAIVLENGLEAVPDQPPPRHANVVGWPEEKDAQKDIALQLAEKASLIISNETTK